LGLLSLSFFVEIRSEFSLFHFLIFLFSFLSSFHRMAAPAAVELGFGQQLVAAVKTGGIPGLLL